MKTRVKEKNFKLEIKIKKKVIKNIGEKKFKMVVLKIRKREKMYFIMEVSKVHAFNQTFLKEQVRYNKRDISVSPRETDSIGCGGGDGYKGFAILCDLESGDCHILWGSWGGANMFE